MTYHSPTELTAALEIAAQAGGKVVAGGTDVYPAARQGQHPDHYLDVTRIKALRGISETENGIRLGAAATWTDVIKADLPPAFDALKQAAREVGSVQIQNAGTIAGNLCNASPAADGVPALLVLEAKVEIASAARGIRQIPLGAFIKGVRKTALEPDELVTAIHVPSPDAKARSAFEKLGSRRYLVISITMTAALIRCDTAGLIQQARIAVGAASPVAQRLPELEKDLIGVHPAKVQIKPDHLAHLTPIDDVRGTADYRLDIIATQCKRAILRAAQS